MADRTLGAEQGVDDAGTMDLRRLGWTTLLESHFDRLGAPGLAPARVVREQRQRYVVRGEFGQAEAQVAGKLRHSAASREAFPTIGDWLAVRLRKGENVATIEAILPRKSAFSRKTAGSQTAEQVVAANIDTVFLVSGLDQDFNLRRIERYLITAWDSGAAPVVVLNKADLRADVARCVAEVESIALGVPVHAVSTVDGQGLAELHQYARVGCTVAFLGSSGVGKSSLINALLGDERLRVQAVREDDSKGHHTTTHKELLLLPDGGMVIDTPGMRELQLWADESALESTFADVEAFAARCRFRNCKHASEPGCAVRDALEAGRLDAGRWESYVKLKRELAHLERKQDHSAQALERRKWKQIAKDARKVTRAKRSFDGYTHG